MRVMRLVTGTKFDDDHATQIPELETLVGKTSF